MLEEMRGQKQMRRDSHERNRKQLGAREDLERDRSVKTMERFLVNL